MYWRYRLIYIGRSTGGLNTRESILEIYLYYGIVFTLAPIGSEVN